MFVVRGEGVGEEGLDLGVSIGNGDFGFGLDGYCVWLIMGVFLGLFFLF